MPSTISSRARAMAERFLDCDRTTQGEIIMTLAPRLGRSGLSSRIANVMPFAIVVLSLARCLARTSCVFSVSASREHSREPVLPKIGSPRVGLVVGLVLRAVPRAMAAARVAPVLARAGAGKIGSPASAWPSAWCSRETLARAGGGKKSGRPSRSARRKRPARKGGQAGKVPPTGRARRARSTRAPRASSLSGLCAKCSRRRASAGRSPPPARPPCALPWLPLWRRPGATRAIPTP